MPVEFSFVVVKKGPIKGLAKRQFNKMMEDAWYEQGSFWFRRLLPRHFQPSAVSRYNMHPYEQKYLNRKLKKKGHQRPLVWSGKTESRTKRHALVKSNSKYVRVTIPGARIVNFNPPRARELRRIADSEATVIGHRMARSLDEKMAAWAKEKTEKTKI